ncbi:MAG: hypothetical protein EOO43_04560 [Flavobacterium sp.]|nr:MAG: hypothetical protein EOO43_04560 [Flavobacterium sp.]
MKLLLLFILSFVMLSVLPVFWNQFQLVAFGFPFNYLKVSVIESSDGSTSIYQYEMLKLVYDLIIVAIAVWAFTRIRPIAKNRI